jgi:formylglycine-generating enzyme required for sulfatase activity
MIDPDVERQLATHEAALKHIVIAINEFNDAINESITAFRDGHPRSTVVNCRSIAESILKRVWTKEGIKGDPDGKMFKDLQPILFPLVKDRLTKDYIRDIQGVGNRAAHESGIPVSSDDALEAIRKLTYVLNWYFKQYESPGTMADPGYGYAPLTNPATQPSAAAQSRPDPGAQEKTTAGAAASAITANAHAPADAGPMVQAPSCDQPSAKPMLTVSPDGAGVYPAAPIFAPPSVDAPAPEPAKAVPAPDSVSALPPTPAPSLAARSPRVGWGWVLGVLGSLALLGLILYASNEKLKAPREREARAVTPAVASPPLPTPTPVSAARETAPIVSADPAPAIQGDLPAMVRIPGGRFQMGCSEGDGDCDSDEKPPHWVTVRPFRMGQFEVTQAQWQAVMGDNPSNFKGKDRPVEQVSWDDVQQFLTRLNALNPGKPFRLPTEAEWEYAARAGTSAGTSTRYWWGNAIGQGNANCNGCGSQWDNKQTAPVGSFKANLFGLYDTAGNVWEWVQDCYHDNYQGAPADGSEWRDSCINARRVLRGGSWSDRPRNARVSNRNLNFPDYRIYRLGLRLAQDL